jgi:hypothetical protein
MTDREYPRWIHTSGHKSVVVETPAAEAAQLDKWAAEDRLASEGADVSETTENALLDEPKRKGGWPKGKPRAPKPELTVN